jgi:hypothetical protein
LQGAQNAIIITKAKKSSFVNDHIGLMKQDVLQVVVINLELPKQLV